ncbi:MAG: 30S ribosome-binding factor RbfA [Synergistaceae bacterium]|jgi:ribosome-binding factor A|nr:30S ribosome-binding factor RbfA [Synergistaceae bacterium]
MVTYRIERLNKEFLRLIAELLSDGVKNETAREAILTRVDCSRDLSSAKVYFTLIDEARKDEVTSALSSVRGSIRGRLGREMHIRQIPELRFIYDDSEKKARAIDALIDQVVQASGEKGD